MVDFRKEIIGLLKSEVKGIDIDSLLEIPPNPELGDYALPCFVFAKQFRKAPMQIAEDMAQKIKPTKNIVKVQAVGPYLNFYVSPVSLAKSTLGDISKKKDKYGSSSEKKEKVMVEYSQPNPLKAFHVGHIRGTALGESLSRILKFNGYNVIQANYMGDTGAHIGKWLWGYLKFHKGEKPPEKDREKWMASVYVEAVKKSEDKPEYKDEINELNYKLENDKDPELKKLWDKFRQLSLDDFDKVYADLDAHFDEWFFESQMEKKGVDLVKKLLKDDLAVMSEGVPIMDLEDYGLGVWVLLRKDSTTLYSAKDIALADIKFRKFKIDKSIYVIGNAQSLHMKQLFKTLELMGFKQHRDCFHLSFDEVRLPSGQMSSRTGQNILYVDLRDKMLNHAIAGTKKRHSDWDDGRIEKSAFSLAISAMKFGMIDHDPNKKIVFDLGKVMDFEGDTGPYIQYSHARCCSILGKAGFDVSLDVDYGLLDTPEEKRLLVLLGRFKQVVDTSAEAYKPFIISRFALDLAHCFNEFYHSCHCISEDKSLSKARLLLVDCTRQVLANALNLLGITAPSEM